jgi:hypothetical protein
MCLGITTVEVQKWQVDTWELKLSNSYSGERTSMLKPDWKFDIDNNSKVLPFVFGPIINSYKLRILI